MWQGLKLFYALSSSLVLQDFTWIIDQESIVELTHKCCNSSNQIILKFSNE